MRRIYRIPDPAASRGHIEIEMRTEPVRSAADPERHPPEFLGDPGLTTAELVRGWDPDRETPSSWPGEEPTACPIR